VISKEGTVTGSISTSGSYSIEIIATDTEGLTANGTLSLTASKPAAQSTSSGGAIYGLLALMLLGLRRCKSLL